MTPWPDAEAGEARMTGDPKARGGDEFAALHATHRMLQDRISSATPPPEVVRDVTARLAEIAALLADHEAPEVERWDGWRPDLPGRGHALLPPYFIDEEDETSLRGRVTFTRFFLGGGSAAHGGSLPLVFDDLLGRVANHHQEGVARTAFLNVNFRKVTPIGVELRAEASLDRLEGRKRWCSARLIDPEGDVVSDAEALFVQLRPGQA